MTLNRALNVLAGQPMSNSIMTSPQLFTGSLLIPMQTVGDVFSNFAFEGGSNLTISLSMQLPPEAPVSNKVLIVVVPTSMLAEQRNSGRV